MAKIYYTTRVKKQKQTETQAKTKKKLRNINKNLKGFEKIDCLLNTGHFYSKPPVCCTKQDIFIDLTA